MHDMLRWSVVVGAGLVATAVLEPRTAHAEIIPAERRVEWSPGVPGGIPHYPEQYDVVASFEAVGDGEADDTQALQQAINQAEPGHAVFLPAGTYRLTSTVSLKPNVVLRGAGPDKTTIVAEHARTAFGIRGGGVTASTALGAAAAKGNTTIQVVDASGIETASYLKLTRGDEVAQIGRVQAVDGSRVTLERPLYGPVEAGARVEILDVLEGAGVEDLFILTRWPELDSYSTSTKVTLNYAAGSWIRNIETSGYVGIEVMFNDCYQCELRDSYLHQDLQAALAQPQFYIYGVELRNGTSDSLVQNNIFDIYRHAMVIQYDNMGGNVFGYNMSWSVYSRSGTSTMRVIESDIELHHDQVESTLIEGNHAEHIRIHFANNRHQKHNTLLRNRVTQAGITPGSDNNIVGNEFPVRKREIQSTGYVPGNNIRAGERLIAHGNYIAGSNALSWDPAIPDRAIPASYYLTERPAWFCDLDWPAFGGDLMPDNERRSPAEVRYWSIRFPEEAPSELSLTHSGGSVQLTWTNNSTREVEFVVVRSVADGAFQRITATAEASYEDKDVEDGVTVSYYVRARNHLGGENGDDLGGESPASNVVSTDPSREATLLADCGSQAAPPPEVGPEQPPTSVPGSGPGSAPESGPAPGLQPVPSGEPVAPGPTTPGTEMPATPPQQGSLASSGAAGCRIVKGGNGPLGVGAGLLGLLAFVWSLRRRSASRSATPCREIDR